MTDLQIASMINDLTEVAVLAGFIGASASHLVMSVGRRVGRYFCFKVTQSPVFKRHRADSFSRRWEARQAARIQKYSIKK